MFLQVIQGNVSDVAGLQRQMQRWNDDLRNGANGYIGSTFGTTGDNKSIGFACFESAEAAAQNSNRAEQSAWWNETEKYYDGPVTFHDTTEVETMLRGINPSAKFVQVMQGKVFDRARLKEIETEMMKNIDTMRPDITGGITAYYGDNQYTSFTYFTSEAEARAGETQPMPPEVQKLMEEWQKISTVDSWFDLTSPWINQ